MARNELGTGFQVAFDDAAERLRTVRDDAIRRVQDAMSATPGWQAAAKAAAAHAVFIASQSETEAVVSNLLSSYVDAGERNPDVVAREVRERLLSGLTAPGLHFFEGSAPEMGSLAPVALKHAAEFESWRDALAADVGERFRRALEARERRAPPSQKPETHRWLRRAALAFLLATTAMSLCGASWLDVARRAVALF
jgi:hypothetical protein